MSLAAVIFALFVVLAMTVAGCLIILAVYRIAILMRKHRIAHPSSFMLLAWVLVMASLMGRTACETLLWAIKTLQPVAVGVER